MSDPLFDPSFDPSESPRKDTAPHHGSQTPHAHSPLVHELTDPNTNVSGNALPGDLLQSPHGLSKTLGSVPEAALPMSESTSHTFNINSLNTYSFAGQSSVPILRSSSTSTPVRETNRVHLEYDPVNKRKVLNTYEILREIGRGEHGKVKLAKDLEHNELVAIKIVSRKSKRNRPSLRFKNNSPQDVADPLDRFIRKLDDYEKKIKREIAIMKKCDQKHIVRLREVLDDKRTFKIYLVLEYMEKGEIKWKKSFKELNQCANDNNANNNTNTNNKGHCCAGDDEIPCVSKITPNVVQPTVNAIDYDDDDDYLLSETYAPNLTFKQSRKIFRDVLLGLEYLHKQGIVHRDIKPANLLVSADNVVKISDFGVSFASSLNSNDEGILMNELELAKTAGTPAFFAPELCQTNFSGSSINLTKNIPPNNINYKIDIWALGVTLYCLLFGKVPFNAESEFKLFLVIVNEDLKFPPDRFAFNAPAAVSAEEFELAKDLLSKLLDKNSATRWDISEIKKHPFTLMDLVEGTEEYEEFFHLNDPQYLENQQVQQRLSSRATLSPSLQPQSQHGGLGPLDELDAHDSFDHNVVGIGARVKKSLFNALKNGMAVERSSSTESSEPSSHFNSKSNLFHTDPSIIISETLYSNSALNSAVMNTSTPGTPSPSSPVPTRSSLSGGSTSQVNSPNTLSATTTGLSPFPVAGIRERNMLLLDVIESEQPASRRSSAGMISEAPQVETKRNAVGDVYLRNQSIVDTFKDIQEQDKRRRSSVLSGLKTTSSNQKSSLSTGTSSILSTASSTTSTPKPFRPSVGIGSIPPPVGGAAGVPSGAIPISRRNTSISGSGDDDIVTVKVGPIDINKSRRGSSVISLPVSESFASLDSVDDDYLALKYQDYIRRKGKDNNHLYGTKSRRGSEVTQSDTALFKTDTHHMNPSHHHVDDTSAKTITERLRNFNLTSSMNGEVDKHQTQTPPQSVFKNHGGFSFMSDSDDDVSDDMMGLGNGPKSKAAIAPRVRKQSTSSSCSTCSSRTGDDHDHDNDDDDDYDESDGDGGNLELAFTAKVEPTSRPQMFGLNSRVRSHESNLPGLIHSPSYADVPIIFQDQIPEFEDVPETLIELPTTMGDSGAGLSMAPSVSVISSTGSQTTITPDGPIGYNAYNAYPTGGNGYTGVKTPQGDKFIFPPRTPEVLGTLSINHSPVTPQGRLKPPLATGKGTIITNTTNNNGKDLVYQSRKTPSSPLGKYEPVLSPSPLGQYEPVSSVSGGGIDSIATNNDTVGVLSLTPQQPTVSHVKQAMAHQYNNHYKKEPLRFPFPNALHYDQEKQGKECSNKTKTGVPIGGKPSPLAGHLNNDRFRSNSITIGILQHETQEKGQIIE